MRKKSSSVAWMNKHTKTMFHISLYALTQILYVGIFVFQFLEDTKVLAYITVGVWIALGLVCAGVDLLTETNSKPQIQSIVRAGLLTILYPFYTTYLYLKYSSKGLGYGNPEIDGLIFLTWRLILGVLPVQMAVQGAILLNDWIRLSQYSNAVCLEITFLSLCTVLLIYSGTAYKLAKRESSPIIWYKPFIEKNARGSVMERLVQAVSSALQVEYGATQPGTTSRLPVIDKKDQRISRKKIGYPTFLFAPTIQDILYNMPSVIVEQTGSIINIILFSAYLKAYALISFVVLFLLNTGVGIKLMKLKTAEAILSATLSFVQASPSKQHCSVSSPFQARFRFLTNIVSLLVYMVTAAVILATAQQDGDNLPVLSCSFNSTLSRTCLRWETSNSLISILLIASIAFGLVSILNAYIVMKKLRHKLIFVPRKWSEKHKAYLEDEKFSGLDLKWRLATVVEVEANKESLLRSLQDQTINMFRRSKCEGLSIAHAKLQDGIIQPKLSFESIDDIETLQTNDDQFQTFEILYGLRFTRYAVYIKDN